MKKFNSLLVGITVSLNLFLLLLAIFRNLLELPHVLQIAGRLHPVILHFPIVLILILLVWQWRKKEPEREKYFQAICVTATICALTAIFGLFLSTEGGYDSSLLIPHLWISTSVSLLLLLLIFLFPLLAKKRIMLKATLLFLSLLVILGSHFGASLTHGEDYLMGPEKEPSQPVRRPITDSSTVFEAGILPILETKCYSCHNESKAKGKLIMTTMNQLLKGGKDGPIWTPGDPESSLIMQRLYLPVSEKKHMPPSGKPQLFEEEIELIHAWIRDGANLSVKIGERDPSDSLIQQMKKIMALADLGPPDTTHYDFPPASPGEIAKLNNPFRVITPLSQNSPALAVQFFIRNNFKASMLDELLPIREQVVTLNLSHMPFGDDQFATIAKFTNLRHLNLNGTDITGENFQLLPACKKLETLAIANTPLKPGNLSRLLNCPSLTKVFVWNSGVDKSSIKGLEDQNRQVAWDLGFEPDSTEVLPLLPPSFSSPTGSILPVGEKLILKHPMPAVRLRYTLDGTDPDSLRSPVYKDPVVITGTTRLNAVATRDGWYSSPEAKAIFFVKGALPDKIELINAPDPKYSAKGGITLMDLQKGELSNLNNSWLGFREKPMVAFIRFNQPVHLKKITLSIAMQLGAFVFPPSQIEIRGGSDEQHLKRIGKLVPTQPEKYIPDENLGMEVLVEEGDYSIVEIRAYPLGSLPAWHNNKGSKGWVFVDEVFFN